jgi:DNA-binding transcriptional regulator LsrR (DeoR family)
MNELELVLIFKGYRASLRAKAEAKQALDAAIADAFVAGTSQSEIARTLGWPRQRVQKVLQDLTT